MYAILYCTHEYMSMRYRFGRYGDSESYFFFYNFFYLIIFIQNGRINTKNPTDGVGEKKNEQPLYPISKIIIKPIIYIVTV